MPVEDKIEKTYSSPLERAFVAMVARLEPLVRRSVRPNHSTLVSFASCVAGGVAFFLTRFARAWLPVSVAVLALHFVLDNLDGAVARARGRSSDRGRFLDIFADSVGIAAVFIGIGSSPYATMEVFLAPLALRYLRLVLMHKWYFPLLSNFELMLLIMAFSVASYFTGPLAVSDAGHPWKLFDPAALGGGALSAVELVLSAARLYRSLD